MIRTIISR